MLINLFYYGKFALGPDSQKIFKVFVLKIIVTFL